MKGLAYLRYARYKDSGVEWLGEIPEGWQVRRLKTIADVNLSNVDKKTVEGEKTVRLCNYVHVYKNERITDNLPFMDATASDAQVRRFTLRRGDVLITKDSETPDDIAVAAWVSADLHGVLCGYHLALIRSRPQEAEGRYIARAFGALGLREQFHTAALGITRFGLGGDAIASSRFCLPSLREQCAIADFLDRETSKIDTLIAKQERLIELLEEKRTALISHAVTQGLNLKVKMKESGVPWLGRIPEHWGVERNKRLFNERDERSADGNGELMTVSHITGITPRSQKDVFMFLAESNEGYKRCKIGDLVINTMWAWMGALGVSAYDGIVSPAYNVYYPVRQCSPRYFDYLFRTQAFIREMIRWSKGVWSSRLRLYPAEFLGIWTVFPPVVEQQSIVEYLDAETKRMDEMEEKVRQLIEFLREKRTALISAAVTGKIKVGGL